MGTFREYPLPSLDRMGSLYSTAYVVQGHRFNIFEDIGCYPVVYNTLPAYFLANMWPVVIGVISAGFGSKSVFVSIQCMVIIFSLSYVFALPCSSSRRLQRVSFRLRLNDEQQVLPAHGHFLHRTPFQHTPRYLRDLLECCRRPSRTLERMGGHTFRLFPRLDVPRLYLAA